MASAVQRCNLLWTKMAYSRIRPTLTGSCQMGGSTSVAYYASAETRLIKKVKDKVSRKCKLDLKRLTSVYRIDTSPLLLLCEVTRDIDREVNTIIREIRGGPDVLVIMVKVCDTPRDSSRHLVDYVQHSTRSRVASLCIFFLDVDMKSGQFRVDNNIACSEIRKFINHTKRNPYKVFQPQITIETLPFLRKPVCFYVEYISYMEEDAITYVENIGQFTLQRCLGTDVRSVSPLVVFTPLYYPDVDDNINSVLHQARDGFDVFLIIINTSRGRRGDVIPAPKMSTFNKMRIGESGMLTYSLDNGCFEQNSANIHTIDRLRRFLGSTVEHNDSCTVNRSYMSFDDGAGTLI